MNIVTSFFLFALKKRVFYILLLCMLLSACTLQERKTVLLPIECDGLYGYADSVGDTVVDCSYIFLYSDTISTIGFAMNKEKRIMCLNNQGKELFETYMFDNGPDHPQEGCFRIVGNSGLIGFADTLGNVVIEPMYKFAFPFERGTSRATFSGELKKVKPDSLHDEHTYWDSDEWVLIENPLLKNDKSSLK